MMSTFQLIIVILLAVYVISSLYFAITGRILTKRQKEIDNEYAEKSMQWEEQVKVLTVRIGEITTENTRLQNVAREWMQYGNSLKTENEKLKASEEAWMKQSEEYKAKYLESEEQLKKFTTAAGSNA